MRLSRPERHGAVAVRRFRISVRPKVRARRAARWSTAVAALALAAAGIAAARRFPYRRAEDEALEFSRVAARRLSFGATRVENLRFEGASGDLERRMRATLGLSLPADIGVFEPGRWARRLESEFPCIHQAAASRSWARHAVTIRVVLHRPVARVDSKTRLAKLLWLSETGTVFEAPEGLYPQERLPVVVLDRNGGSDRASLAQFLSAVSREGALPSRLVRFEHRSPEEGWQAELEDGTRLLWGRLNWTEEKLLRLREVMSDAGKRFDGRVTADLRYFEDGKILVRPMGAEASEAARKISSVRFVPGATTAPGAARKNPPLPRAAP